jgi:hypothetical protein
VAVEVMAEVGVGGALRVRVPDTEGEPLLRLAVGERLPVRVAVLLAVEVRVKLALPDTVRDSRDVADLEMVILVVRLGRAMEAVPLGEEEGVLELAMERVGETLTVEVLLAELEPVTVLLPPMLREPVADTEGDLVLVMVRVPLGEEVPVLEEVAVAVPVRVTLAEPDRRVDLE